MDNKEKDKIMTAEGTGDFSVKKNIVILGGGFAGLRIAHQLSKLGYNISLIEKTLNIGGMVQSFCYHHEDEPFCFDYGPHLFFEDYISEYRQLLGKDMVPITSCFRMYTSKSIYSYPLRPFELLMRTNPLDIISYMVDFLTYKIRAIWTGGEENTLNAFLSNRFGKRLFNDFYSPYIEKCCGLSPEQISVLWAKERENVTGKSLWDNIIKMIKSVVSSQTREKLTKTNDPSAENITAWYPRLGAGQLCDAMAKELKNQNVYLNASVRRIHVKNHSVQNVVIEIDGKEKIITGDYFVSTIPLPRLFEYFQPVYPNLAKAVKQLRYRRVRLVCLLVRRERILNCLEIFSMNRQHIFKRVYEPKAMSNDMSPLGKSSLCLEVCCDSDDNIASMPIDELVARSISDLISMELIESPNEIMDSFVIEMPFAYPVYAKGFEKYREELLNEINKFDNFLTSGRQGLFRYHAMTNEVMEMADSVAQFLNGNRDKRLSVQKGSQWGLSYY